MRGRGRRRVGEREEGEGRKATASLACFLFEREECFHLSLDREKETRREPEGERVREGRGRRTSNLGDPSSEIATPAAEEGKGRDEGHSTSTWQAEGRIRLSYTWCGKGKEEGERPGRGEDKTTAGVSPTRKRGEEEKKGGRGRGLFLPSRETGMQRPERVFTKG